MPFWKKINKSDVQTNDSGSQWRAENSDIYQRDATNIYRELNPDFGGDGGKRWGADIYIRTICHVCRLQLFPKEENPYFCAAKFPDQIQYMTPGGLSLCKRHYDLVDGLIKRGVSVDQWPSQLIRGIVTFSKAWLQSGNDGVTVMQRSMGTIQTTKTVITPAPIFGNTYSPVSTLGGTGTYSYDFLVFPMQRQVTDQKAVQELNWDQNYLQLSHQRVQVFGAQVAKYSELLERVRRENPPKFVTCLRCGQSEMPLGTKKCTWCGQSQGYTGEAFPVPCLVEDVDPLDVVPLYKDRTGTAVLFKENVNDEPQAEAKKNQYNDQHSEEDTDADDEEATVFCTNCGTKVQDQSSNFCDNCGSRIEKKGIPVSLKNQERKVSPKSSDQVNSPLQEVQQQAANTQSKVTDNPGVKKGGNDCTIATPPPVLKESKQNSSPEDVMKFCPECGKNLPFEGTKYCPYCGSKIPSVN
jgi:ribosomal protein L37E